ncbi:MAG: hypothetical protein KF863_10910 [Rubrivivax sp.]|nr:hypothetical protein [Rubrivivax sp.]
MTKWSERPRPAESDYLLAVQACWLAVSAIVLDDTVWDEEAARVDADPLPWPLTEARSDDGTADLLRWLAPHAVTLATAFAADRFDVGDADPSAAGFQTLLRVVKRGLDAAERVLRRDFGGGRGGRVRLDGGRSLNNWIKAFNVELAAGRTVAEKAELLRMGKSSVARAIHRTLHSGDAKRRKRPG